MVLPSARNPSTLHCTCTSTVQWIGRGLLDFVASTIRRTLIMNQCAAPSECETEDSGGR